VCKLSSCSAYIGDGNNPVSSSAEGWLSVSGDLGSVTHECNSQSEDPYMAVSPCAEAAWRGCFDDERHALIDGLHRAVARAKARRGALDERPRNRLPVTSKRSGRGSNR